VSCLKAILRHVLVLVFVLWLDVLVLRLLSAMKLPPVTSQCQVSSTLSTMTQKKKWALLSYNPPAAQSEFIAMSPKYINAINHDQFNADTHLLTPWLLHDSPANRKTVLLSGNIGPCGMHVFPRRHYHETSTCKDESWSLRNAVLVLQWQLTVCSFCVDNTQNSTTWFCF